MTTRRILLVVVLLASASAGAFGQVVISPATLPAGGGVFLLNQAIPTQQLTTNYPDNFVFWTISSGTFPPGLFLDTDNFPGRISGIPTQAGIFTFTVTGQINQVGTGSRQYTVYVASCLPLALTAVAHAPGAAGNPYVGDTFHASC